MADDDLNGNLWDSQRGMLLVVALVVYLAAIIAIGFGGKVPESALTTLGALLILGFGFFYKDKAAEKTAAEATKTEVAKIEATKNL